VSEIVRALGDDPDALSTEIVAIRLDLAQTRARDLLAQKKGRAGKLKELRRSPDFDDRLTLGIFLDLNARKAEARKRAHG
jgi:hypothetical protein